MGLAAHATSRSDTFRGRATLVVAVSIVMGASAFVAAAAVLIAVVAYGASEIGWVISAPGAQGVLQPLAATGLIVSIALPVVCAAGILAAAAIIDPSIGGVAGVALRRLLEWTAGIPPVVVGAAVFLCAVGLRERNAIAAAVAALVILNLPSATARMARSFAAVPREVREASAALGVSAAASFAGVLVTQAAWSVAATVLAIAALMVGETSAVALATSASTGPEPLSVHVWHYASNSSLASSEAAAAVVLALVIAVLLASSRACLRRATRAGVQP